MSEPINNKKSNENKTKETILIKIGGSLVARDIDNLIKDIKEQSKNYNFIIVHGGGPQINELYEKMNKKPKIYQTPKGFQTRYTDPEAIDIIKMALAGYTNKTLVELFEKAGLNAFGFTGADGRTITAERKDKIMILTDAGKRLILRDEYSGKSPRANVKIIKFLLEEGYLPIIGSMSISENGELLNVDGDRVANAIGIAMNIKRLISLTDVEGIYENMENKKLIKTITLTQAKEFMKKIEGGMKKKLYSAIDSLNSGIEEVFITSGLIEKPISNALKGDTGTKIYIK